jgi:mono/diheme cytochrome c family protein
MEHSVTTRSTELSRSLSSFLAILIVVACTAPAPSVSNSANMFAGRTSQSDVARGRYLVIEHGCGDCHSSGVPSPLAEGWLAGLADTDSGFVVGPFRTRPRNLTPDNATGLGRFSERQIFNALRYGLRPGETPDVEITSNVPGQGNFPLHPKYLAPPMPWIAYRHMSDADLLAIATYLKHGLKPVSHRVKDSDGPPDFWVGTYTVDKVGPYPAPAFPAATESGQR